MNNCNVLLLPGWYNSGAAHWQSLWEAQHGYVRVQQHDWERPLRGDWQIQLEEAILACDTDRSGPVVLVAHSLGCILVAAWAAHSRNTHRVRGALLVAPGDAEREEIRGPLPSWSPIVRQRLPFPSILLGSRNDPYCRFERAQGLATDWGARFIDYGERGHINADSGLGDWPEGHTLLQTLMQPPA
ncbi:RBBP9/YdeN family alpha/beta hydrolase [Hylemonella sp. W303a]|uniref:RBBP9/YdeN family alpha/beta hydrolase n=1 Tax=Hylemonella sp. W303a TaxID=3389873 RepID=UPI00396B0CEE